MTEQPKPRRRWVSLGEIIAICALAVSAVGVWISYRSTEGGKDDKPTRVVEQKQAIPLVLRGRPESDGRRLTISPVEDSHALESLALTIAGASRIELGSDGELSADQVEAVLKDRDKASHSVRVRIDARYVEAGTDRRGGGNYTLRYRWEGGGLFGGRSLRLTGLSRG